jgi:hypothetical protein
MPFAPLSAGAGDAASSGDIFVLPHGATGLKQTVVGTGTGTQSYSLVAAGLLAQVSTQEAKGASEQIGLDPHGKQLSLSGSDEHRSVSLALTDGSGAEQQTLQVTVSGTSAATLGASGQNGFTFATHGGGANASFTLTGAGAGKVPVTLQSPVMHIPAGQAVRLSKVRPSSAGASATITVGHRIHQLHAASGSAHLGAVHLSLAHGGRVRATVRARALGGSAVTQAELAWIARRGHTVVAHAAMPLKGRKAKTSWSFGASQHGRYAITARLVVSVVRKGVPQTAVASRSAGIAVR